MSADRFFPAQQLQTVPFEFLLFDRCLQGVLLQCEAGGIARFGHRPQLIEQRGRRSMDVQCLVNEIPLGKGGFDE